MTKGSKRLARVERKLRKARGLPRLLLIQRRIDLRARKRAQDVIRELRSSCVVCGLGAIDYPICDACAEQMSDPDL